MTEFSAAANLDIQIPDDELRSARRRIERDLGSVEVGISSTAPDGGRLGGRTVGQRAGILDASRKQLGTQETLVDLAEARNELLEDLAEGGGGGGGIGAGGGFAAGRLLGGGGLLAGGGAALAGGGALAAPLLAWALFNNDQAAASGRQVPPGRNFTDPFPQSTRELLNRQERNQQRFRNAPPITSNDESGSPNTIGTAAGSARFSDEARGGSSVTEGSRPINLRNDINITANVEGTSRREVERIARGAAEWAISQIEKQFTGNRGGNAPTGPPSSRVAGLRGIRE